MLLMKYLTFKALFIRFKDQVQKSNEMWQDPKRSADKFEKGELSNGYFSSFVLFSKAEEESSFFFVQS